MAEPSEQERGVGDEVREAMGQVVQNLRVVEDFAFSLSEMRASDRL